MTALGPMALTLADRNAWPLVALVHHSVDRAAAAIWLRALEAHYQVTRIDETTSGAPLEVPTLFLASADAIASDSLAHLGNKAWRRRHLYVIAHRPVDPNGLWGLKLNVVKVALFRLPGMSVPVLPRSGSFLSATNDHDHAINEALVMLADAIAGQDRS